MTRLTAGQERGGRPRPRRYPAYKDFGVEWLGLLPKHWEVKRLWHLTQPGRRIMYGIVLPGPDVDDGVPIVKGGDVSAGRLSLDKLSRTTREIEASYARSRLKGGDLVYAIRGSIGEVAVVPHELEGANLTQDAARVSYTSAVHGPWLLHTLTSAPVFAQLESGALGATIRGINIRDLKRATIPLPPPLEQRAIAAFLDGETTKIDALVARKERLIELLKEKRAALVSRAVTKGLDLSVPMKDSGVEWIGRIPEHWRTLPLKLLGELQAGAGFPDEEQGVLTEEIPFFKVGDMAQPGNEREMAEAQHFVSRATAKRLRARVLPANTVVFAKVGAALKLNKRRLLVRPSCIDNNMMGFVPTQCDPRWAVFWLSCVDLGELANPGAVPSVNEGQMRDIPAIAPPPAEQSAIADFLLHESGRFDELIGRVRAGIARVKELRTALISAAVTGKIDVRDAH